MGMVAGSSKEPLISVSYRNLVWNLALVNLEKQTWL